MDIVNEIFVYCTDFIINLANLFDISYFEVNTIIFCVIYPVVLSICLVLFIRNWYILQKLN